MVFFVVNIKEKIGKNLKTLRGNRSQGELCISLNRSYKKLYGVDDSPFTQAKISKIEKGEQMIDYSQLLTYADYFNVTTDSIMGKDQKESENTFYPDINDITVDGIFSAVNYLIVAFGIENIIDKKEVISYVGEGQEEAYDVTPILKFYKYNELGEYTLNPVGEYINKVLSTHSIKSELESLGEREIYVSLLRKWANTDSLRYYKENREVEEDIELPF